MTISYNAGHKAARSSTRFTSLFYFKTKIYIFASRLTLNFSDLFLLLSIVQTLLLLLFIKTLKRQINGRVHKKMSKKQGKVDSNASINIDFGLSHLVVCKTILHKRLNKYTFVFYKKTIFYIQPGHFLIFLLF